MLANIKSRKVRMLKRRRSVDIRRADIGILTDFYGAISDHFPNTDEFIKGHINFTLTDERETDVTIERARYGYILKSYGNERTMCPSDFEIFTGLRLKVGESVYIDSIWFSKT